MPWRQLVDEAERAVVVAGADPVEHGDCDARRPSGSPARFSHDDATLEPAAPDLELDVRARRRAAGSGCTSRGDLAVDAEQLVAGGQPGARGRRAGRDRDDAGGRTSAVGVYGVTGPGPSLRVPAARWPSTRCCSPSRGASAPASRWRSRRSRGWCAPSSRPCTATTRSSTTGSWSTASASLGVVFVDDVDEVPGGRPLMLSAHGSAPEVVAAARARGRFVVNAVCPLVTKVHHEAKVRAGKGYTILYVGHEGHDEAVGTLAVAPDAIRPGRARGRGRRRWPLATPNSRRAARPDHAVPPRLGRASPSGRAERFPELWTARAQRPLLRHDEPAGGAGRDRRTAPTPSSSSGRANSSNTLALEKVAREAGLPARAAGRRPRRARPRRPRPAPSASPPGRARPRTSSRP